MKMRTMAVAAVMLLSGISIAAAADNAMSRASTDTAAASDTLNLSNAQQKTLWSDISGQASKQPAPAGFSAAVGAVIPSSVSTQPIPGKAASDVPTLRPYHFAMFNDNKLLIVNPSDKKIVKVITQ